MRTSQSSKSCGRAGSPSMRWCLGSLGPRGARCSSGTWRPRPSPCTRSKSALPARSGSRWRRRPAQMGKRSRRGPARGSGSSAGPSASARGSRDSCGHSCRCGLQSTRIGKDKGRAQHGDKRQATGQDVQAENCARRHGLGAVDSSTHQLKQCVGPVLSLPSPYLAFFARMQPGHRLGMI